MLVADEEVPELKSWVIKKLENISDADSDVLADYVLALLRADVSDFELRSSAIENLEDFLRGNTVAFIDDLLKAARLKSYLPAHLRKPIAPASPDIAPSRTGTVLATASQSSTLQGRKRSYNDALGLPRGQDVLKHAGERQVKQPKRGNSRLHDGDGNWPGVAFPANDFSQAMGGLHFDPSDPLGAMMAFQQAMGLPIPQIAPDGSFQMPNLGHPGPLQPSRKGKSKKRCRDYDRRGICHRGVKCPFVHDDNQIIVPQTDGFDRRTPTATEINAQRLSSSPNGEWVQGRGKPNGKKTSSKRANSSKNGPSHDRSDTGIVVVRIPEEYCTEEQVRSFFSAFGPIREVTVKNHKNMATVHFEDRASAQAAVDSPKVIFDNRFVQLYWLSTRGESKPQHSDPDRGASPNAEALQEPSFDKEQFERDAEAAQKRFEERKALKADTDVKLADIAQRTAALIEEKQALETKLRSRGGLPPQSDADKETEALRAQLRALEQEAKNLGLDPEPWPSSRGRGAGVRGRGRGTTRGAYPGSSWPAAPPGRGAYAGHRGARGALRGRAAYGAFNLDNRPKRVLVRGTTFDAARGEALRQHLATAVGGFLGVEPHGEAGEDTPPEAVTVDFDDRAMAEVFFYGTRDLPGVGKVDMEWVKEPAPPAAARAETGEGKGQQAEAEEGEVQDDRSMGEREAEEAGGEGEMDYDVADDEDRWA